MRFYELLYREVFVLGGIMTCYEVPSCEVFCCEVL